MRTSGGKRFDPSEARERCVSNGPQWQVILCHRQVDARTTSSGMIPSL